MILEARVKELVETELGKPGGLRLSQIATRCNVNYDRLWRFMRPDYPDYIQASDAQAIYETLSGQPLFPASDV